MTITLEALIARKIGFASHQNSVPLVRELSIAHAGEHPLQDLTLTLSSDPAFVEPRSWNIARLNPGDRLGIAERDIKLDAGYLAGLSESLGAEVTLRVTQGERLLVEQHYPTELLARTEWGGLSAMPELLAAFCMPNDPAVDRVLKAASLLLRGAGRNDAINGYEGRSRSRSWELASAIWSAVCAFELSYALPPASFEQQGQKIRPPSQVLENGVATCLDSALLFAAALEQAGLNALLMMTEGHAFVGLWLQPQEFSQLLTDEASAVRKRIDLKEMLVFETTLATRAPVPGFSQAIAAAERQLDDDKFIMAIDLHRARMQKIRPLALASAVQVPGADATPAAPAAAQLEAAPALPGFDVEVDDSSAGVTGKLVLWQRKLLDLTTRNRLLHLPDSAKGVRLHCADPAALEDVLAGGQRIRVVPVPDLEGAGRDPALYQQQHHESLLDEVARQALARGEVLAALDKAKLDATLIDLYRKARTDLEEGGANTLFLAIGFLKWKKAVEDPRVYSAPLILLPVKLERKSALSGITLGLLDEEPRFNLTLLELLRHDFELTIPGLEGDLPGDESGIDVAGVWNLVRRAVRDVAGFEVSTEVVLGTFSFAKYLMWKDLAANTEQLLQSPLVQHLLQGDGGQAFVQGEGQGFPRPEQLDATVKPGELFTPLPADSSQLAAVVASAGQRSFVLDGPPGTGKSQTIANMIAHNLALGRRVLFVAEKRAALDVVYRRLAEKGLGEFCLELHSSKASKVEVLKQLDRAWDVRDSLSAEQWQAEAQRLETLRSRLNEVVEVLHRRAPNGWSLHQAIGRVVRDHSPATPRLPWSTASAEDAAQYGQLLDLSRRLGLNGQAGHELAAGFGALAQSQWSNAWQAQIAASARELPDALDELATAGQRLLAITHLPLAAGEVGELQALHELLGLIGQTHGIDLAFAFAADAGARVRAARRAAELLHSYRQLQQGLSLTYAADACRRVPVATLRQQWQQAEGKFWFFATWAKNKVAGELASLGGASGEADVPADLDLFERQQALVQELDGLAGELQTLPGWHGVASDGKRLQHATQLAERLRSALSALVTSPEQLIALRGAVSRLVVEANDMLAPGGQIETAQAALQRALARYATAIERFAGLAGADLALPMGELRATCNFIQQHEPQLKAWCDWCRVREQASVAGLAPLAEALQGGQMAPAEVESAFVTAYAHGFATHGIDNEPLLRNFVAAEHMSDIAAFGRLDDELAQLSVRYIRARQCGLIPSRNDIVKDGGFAVLKKELQKSRRHKPVRQLAVEMGDALNRLAPCMLMSPLSIAQYLPAELPPFDLVIFDEASQIAPWDAIGSIARGRQVVIAGDPRQMPPTNFFNRGANAGDDDTAEDMESILDECLGAGVPSHSLSWHYRSRHESLIAFSNHRYYDSNLITFPAAETRASAVQWWRVEGVYAKGKGRHNQAEAQAIVDETVKRLTDPAFIAAGYSIGIITLNADQQKLVSDLLDRARQQYPQIEPFFQDSQTEPVVVKNLETVQGDERDLIILGIGYGPTEPGAGVMSMNFGPLNKDGGWRRLNVAITRSRREMLVFSSFDPGMIDLNRTNARAVRDLKHFIEFAQHGPRALAEAVQGSLGGYDSPFEQAVAEGLRALGWQVVSQIGVSRFRIDLGIVHPDRPGDYLAGVECDGATYHSAATARDRDKVRGAILQGLGWNLLRLWSTDWWVDKAGALQRLHAGLEALLVQSRTGLPDAAPVAAAPAAEPLEEPAK